MSWLRLRLSKNPRSPPNAQLEIDRFYCFDDSVSFIGVCILCYTCHACCTCRPGVQYCD